MWVVVHPWTHLSTIVIIYNMKNNENIEVAKQNKFTKFIDKTKHVITGHKEKPPFTAEYAWLETTYGYGSYTPMEKRIENKQKDIMSIITSKFPPTIDGQVRGYANRTYNCVIDIEEDLSSVIDKIFEPFIMGGFKIICLSEKIDEIEDEHVYLISWKHIFKNTK